MNRVLEAQEEGVPSVDSMLVHAEKERLARLQGALADQRRLDQGRDDHRRGRAQQDSSVKSARHKYTLPRLASSASIVVKGGVRFP